MSDDSTEPTQEPPIKLWGGRFSGDTNALVDAFNASIDFDRRLYREDIAGSIAHARMLASREIISIEDRDAIVAGLEEIRAELAEQVMDDIRGFLESSGATRAVMVWCGSTESYL